MSFAALAKEVTKRSKGELGVLTFDARGHGALHVLLALIIGKTRVEKGDETDLSLETLTDDFVGVIQQAFPDPKDASLIVR